MELPRNLRYSSDEEPGYYREGEPGQFRYLDHAGQPVADEQDRARIEAMVIPPMWTQVWICADDGGYVQCTGRDGRNRKQYVYHADYVAFRQAAKFRKMVEFASALPELRVRVDVALRKRKWTKERMLALTVRLLDRAHLRIGSRHYQRENETYGLTTLRRRHVKDDDGPLRLCFKGKSNKFRQVTIRNRRLAKLVKQVAELPGYQLFRYRDEDGNTQTLDSADVNEYLHEHMGDQFTAKDFRTWGGTSLAVKLYPQALALQEATQRGRLEPKLVGLVAKELGNTKSVCRQYYIHPEVLAKAEAGELPHELWTDHNRALELAPYERYTLRLIREYEDTGAA